MVGLSTATATEPSSSCSDTTAVGLSAFQFAQKIVGTASPQVTSRWNGAKSGGSNGRKFKTIAQGIRIMPQSAAARSALTHEQNAFLSKYGMSAAVDSAADGGTNSGGPAGRSSEWADFRKAPVDYIRRRLIVDSTKNYFYYWTIVVSAAYLYNLLMVVFRCVFVSVKDAGIICIGIFIGLDVITDLIYLVDSFLSSRTGFLEQGLLVRDVNKVTRVYWRSARRYVDLLSVLPLDYVYELALATSTPILRFNRLIRIERIVSFINNTETRISSPMAFRVSCVVAYILVLIHWNACAYFLVSSWIGVGTDSWVYGDRNFQSLPRGGEDDSLLQRYLYSFYWSTLQLTTVGEVPSPIQSSEFVLVTIDLMFGVLIFATIVGNVGSMIASMSEARSDFQNNVDSVKQFMDARKVSRNLINRVLKWFDYLWLNKQALSSDEQVLGVLPTRLQTEIAMNVHFETLRKVRIFQDCESGLLAELVLKLQLQVFSPMDYVCRKGDIGREMYIVRRGRLQVVADDGIKVLHTLQEGAVFGELSILNISGNKQGNRRSASIRSVGYADLFVLKKADLWAALREYPDVQKVLIQKGREILRKDGLLDESAPVETKTLEEYAHELRHTLEKQQFRLAKLTAEYVNTERKLQTRVEYLEDQIRRYGLDDEGFSESSSEDEPFH